MRNALINWCPELEPYVEEIARTDPGSEPDLVRVLTRAAERFARAGGRWSAEEWGGLSEIERVAAEAAGERVWRMRTAEAAEAVGCPEGAAAMRAPVDGGAALEDLAMDRVAAKAMSLVRPQSDAATTAESTEVTMDLAGLFQGGAGG